MSILSMLSAVLIGPLKLGFEVIFTCAYRFIGHPGLAIVCLSLIMNVLVLPLYRRADAMQERARDTEARLHKGVAHIKKTFSGDERMMILNTYYRQNDYKATSALNGSISLLLEIPFFLAAYQFLSGLDILNGVSFGPIRDLGAPDGLLVLGGVTVNLLPILMTLINCVSSALYLKGFPMKTKVQLYAMALFFLVFLYTSPACLVFYWTLNNLFSLCKNIFYKLKNPKKVLRILLCGAGIVLAGYGAVFFPADPARRGVVVALGVGLCLPMALALLRPHIRLAPGKKSRAPSSKLFLAACGFLTVFLGLLIPTTFLAASPQEYIDVTYFFDPMWYAVSALCLATGVFLVWMQVFYRLAGERGKVWFENAAVAACAMALVNYMCFGTGLGTLSSSLKYESGLHFTWLQQAGNLLALAAVGAALWFVLRRWRRAVAGVLAVAVLALLGMSAVHLVTVRRSVSLMKATALQGTEGPVQFTLSRTGRNVVVIMLDRAMGEYVPYLVNEKPELKEMLDGFTYYANTVSFGGHTIFGAPALFGGYEYTPVEMNRRDGELLADKHDEALKVLPVLFDRAGYDVTVCDPAYAGHQWIPDLSIFADYPDIRAYITSGRFAGEAGKQRTIDSRMRNFFCFSLMKSMPLFAQSGLYDGGAYNQASSLAPAAEDGDDPLDVLPQGSEFIKEFSTLRHMEDMTRITDDPAGGFLSLTNCATHEPIELQAPEYLPAAEVDNGSYNARHPGRFTWEGRTLQMYDPLQAAHYDTNMAVLLQLGRWFDYLRAQGVYDNTRIILVSDHGYKLWQLRELVYDAGEEDIDLEWYFPLLMVKDFDAEGFTVSDEFMTNADVPTLALRGLMDDAKNPFTGKVIENSEKLAHPQYIIDCHTWSPTDNTGNTFMDARWLSVEKDAWDLSNWSVRPGGEVTLKEHSDE